MRGGQLVEVAECIRTLRGVGPTDLEELSVQLAAQMLLQAHGSSKAGFATREEAAKSARAQLHNGKALAAFREMVAAQGGDPTVIDALANSPHGPSALSDRMAERSSCCRASLAPAMASRRRSSRVQASAGVAAHTPFWGAPTTLSPGAPLQLDAFFDHSVATDEPSDGPAPDTSDAKRQALSSVQRSLQGRAARQSPVWRV